METRSSSLSSRETRLIRFTWAARWGTQACNVFNKPFVTLPVPKRICRLFAPGMCPCHCLEILFVLPLSFPTARRERGEKKRKRCTQIGEGRWFHMDVCSATLTQLPIYRVTEMYHGASRSPSDGRGARKYYACLHCGQWVHHLLIGV